MRLRLERGKYRTKDEFYGDLELIISNSRLYHRNNPDFLRLTKKFENFCTKIRRLVDPKRQRPSKQIKYCHVNKKSKGKKKTITKKQKEFFSSSESEGILDDE